MLGIDGCVLTLVGDATAGMSALATSLDVLEAGEADRCLVVASQEVDWISAEGYRRWGVVDGRARGGAQLAEGACALLLGPAGPEDVTVQRVHPGVAAMPELRHESLRQICADFARGEPPDLAVHSAAKPSPDAEEEIVAAGFPRALRLAPKSVLGEAFAASTLLQVACGCLAIRKGLGRCAAITVSGWSGQSGGAVLTASAAGE